MQGAIKSGDSPSETSTGVGTALLSQTSLVTYDADLVAEAQFVLPAGAQITSFNIDTLTAYNSATSATLTIGSASGGSQYVGSVDAKTAGRAAPTLSAAQLTAMANIGTNTTVFATVTSVGQPSAGNTRVTVFYTGGSR
jgi:hypothetical protein